jgi:exosortase
VKYIRKQDYCLELVGLLPAGVALAWLVSKARWFWQRNPELNFGWIVLMLCAFLLWEAWPTRPAQSLRLSWGSMLAGLVGLGMLALTQIYQNAYGLTSSSMSGLAMGALLMVAANLLYVFGGPGLAHFAFPIGFFLIALPIPSVIYAPVVSGLQGLVAAVDVELLGLLGVPASQVGSLIHIPAGTVGIDEACSGIRSLQSTVMATLFIGYLTFKSQGLRVLLLVAGVLWAILGNVLRSLFLSLVANRRGIGSIETYHDAAGWSILAFTVAGVVLVAWGLSKIEKLKFGKPEAETTLET